MLEEIYEKYRETEIPSFSVIHEKARKYPKTSLSIILLFLLIFISILQKVPQYQVSEYIITSQKDLAELANSYRLTLVQLIGGSVLLLGLYFTWGNLITAKEGQITERFTRAINQLGATDQSGNPKLEIRLGGIYALERIANESQEDYWPIMEILTSYVRMNSSNGVNGNNENMHIRMDIQAALTVLERRKYVRRKQNKKFIIEKRKTYDPENGKEAQSKYINEDLMCLNLNEAHLEGAHLEGANLERVDLKKVLALKNLILEKLTLKNLILMKLTLKGLNFVGLTLKGLILLRLILKMLILEKLILEEHTFKRLTLKELILGRLILRKLIFGELILRELIYGKLI